MHCHLRVPVPPAILSFNRTQQGNEWLTDCNLTIFNLAIIRHLGFDIKWI